ncbi:hypothetical protein HZH68_004262 [Vespula germanica]|uniref:Uncharacterized protein n=1 Tax=Vespula germanica TaxID=30212 RepID=A0A834KN78_VESGE|nr:hypothetical protein HZH68_004262 [Vespula germanica]
MYQPARIEGSGGVQSNIVNPDRIRGSERSIALSFTVLVLAATPFASAQYLHKIGNRIMHSVICSSLSCRSGNSQKLACESSEVLQPRKELASNSGNRSSSNSNSDDVSNGRIFVRCKIYPLTFLQQPLAPSRKRDATKGMLREIALPIAAPLLKRLRLKAKNLESPNYDPPERNAILRERRRKHSEESRETSRWSRSAVRRNDLEV